MTTPKRCARCRCKKPLTEFTKNASQADGKNHTCRVCHRKYTQKHYVANKAYYVEKARRNTRAVVLELRRLKRVPCFDCKVRYPHYVMDFDHVRGKKRCNVAAVGRLGRLVALAEVAKCEVVCANCHRIRTHRRKQ